MLTASPVVTESRGSQQTQSPIIALAGFSASVIHDLRNPVATICAGTELLMDRNLTCAQSRRVISSIYRASRRIEQLLEDLISMSQGSRESKQHCKIIDILQRTVQYIADAAVSQGVRVEITAPDWIQLSIPRRCIESVLLNLMNNALESMPTGGHLRIAATVDQKNLYISVDDTGRGVPDELRTKLFEPFASGGKKNGTGLGLALSRQTVRDLGGELELGAKAGPGAIFYVRLPSQDPIRSETG